MRTTRIKADILTVWMLVPVAAFFALCVLLSWITTPLSGAMLLPGALVFLSSYGVFLLAARKRIGRFVRMYVSNFFYVNAEESSGKAMRQSVLTGIVIALFLLVCSGPFARLTGGSTKATASFRVSLLFPVLHAALGAYYGFAEGAGKRGFVLALDAARSVFVLCIPLAAGVFGYRYGQKLDALLLTDDCGAAYCALFVFVAMMVTELVFLVLLLAVRLSETKRMRKSKKSKPRYLGDEPAFFKSCGQLMLSTVLPCAITAVTCACITKAAGPETGSGGAVHMLSAYMLRFLAPASFAGIVVSRHFIGACFRLPGLSDEIDSGGMSLRFRRLLHRMSLMLPLTGALLALLSEPLNTVLFPASGDGTSFMMPAAAFYSMVFCAFVVFCILLSLTKRRTQMVRLSVLSFLFCLLFALLSVWLAPDAVPFLLAVQTLSLFLYTAGAYGALAELMQESRTKLFRMLIKPFLIACVCTLMLYPVRSELVHVIGEAATCVICGTVGVAVYLVLLSVFKGLERGDLRSVPFGRTLVKISLRGRG